MFSRPTTNATSLVMASMVKYWTSILQGSRSIGLCKSLAHHAKLRDGCCNGTLSACMDLSYLAFEAFTQRHSDSYKNVSCFSQQDLRARMAAQIGLSIHRTPPSGREYKPSRGWLHTRESKGMIGTWRPSCTSPCCNKNVHTLRCCRATGSQRAKEMVLEVLMPTACKPD